MITAVFYAYLVNMTTTRWERLISLTLRIFNKYLIFKVSHVVMAHLVC